MNKNVLCLFAGAGGAVQGFKDAGFNVVAAVDFNEDCIATLRENHDDVQVIQADLGETSPQEFALEHDIAPDDIDVVVGGPPCQGFSLNGNRDPDDDRNELVTDFLDYISMYSPERVVMENVTGMLSMEDGAVVDYVHDRFEELGYDSNHEILNSVDFGVPQKRERVIFIATTGGEMNFPKREGDNVVTISNAFDGIREDHPNTDSPNQRQTTIDRIKDTEKGEPLYESYTQRIRLDETEPAPTLVCGGERPQWQLAHPTEDRGLSIRERAAIQTFPHDYKFCGGIVAGRIQTGNALPCKMAAGIANSLYD
jgi:DNA (cytosine-5)-methyltransferase 1